MMTKEEAAKEILIKYFHWKGGMMMFTNPIAGKPNVLIDMEDMIKPIVEAMKD